MEEYRLNQSSPRRAWEETTKSFHKVYFFWGVEVVAMGGFAFLGTVVTPVAAGKIVSAAYPIVGAVIGAIIGFGLIYLTMLILSPYKQRDEARVRVQALEGKYKPCVSVKPDTGRRKSDWERTEHLMWAELQVTNISNKPLEDVVASIATCLTVQEKQNSPNGNDYLVWDF